MPIDFASEKNLVRPGGISRKFGYKLRDINTERIELLSIASGTYMCFRDIDSGIGTHFIL